MPSEEKTMHLLHSLSSIAGSADLNVRFADCIAEDIADRCGKVTAVGNAPDGAVPRPGSGREDESADPVGDGHSDAEFAVAQPPVPGRENPGPDTPEPVDPDAPDLPDEEGDVEHHRPGHGHPP
jgi:hypothetical protein